MNLKYSIFLLLLTCNLSTYAQSTCDSLLIEAYKIEHWTKKREKEKSSLKTRVNDLLDKTERLQCSDFMETSIRISCINALEDMGHREEAFRLLLEVSDNYELEKQKGSRQHLDWMVNQRIADYYEERGYYQSQIKYLLREKSTNYYSICGNEFISREARLDLKLAEAYSHVGNFKEAKRLSAPFLLSTFVKEEEKMKAIIDILASSSNYVSLLSEVDFGIKTMEIESVERVDLPKGMEAYRMHAYVQFAGQKSYLVSYCADKNGVVDMDCAKKEIETSYGYNLLKALAMNTNLPDAAEFYPQYYHYKTDDPFDF